jgi:uncharacterized protein YlaI
MQRECRSASEQSNSTVIRCYFCDKPGHMQRECRSRLASMTQSRGTTGFFSGNPRTGAVREYFSTQNQNNKRFSGQQTNQQNRGQNFQTNRPRFQRR